MAAAPRALRRRAVPGRGRGHQLHRVADPRHQPVGPEQPGGRQRRAGATPARPARRARHRRRGDDR